MSIIAGSTRGSGNSDPSRLSKGLVSVLRFAALGLLLLGCGGTEPRADAPAKPTAVVERGAEPEPVETKSGSTGGTASSSAASTSSGSTAATPAEDTATEPVEVAPAEPGASGKSFTVDARLVDLGHRVSHCGVIHAVAVWKLEVVEVVDGRFSGDTLYIYVSCPEMLPRKEIGGRFVEGEVYRWVLDTRIGRRTAGAKSDAFEEEADDPRYRLMTVGPAPAE